MFGVVTFVLNFIPSIGSIVATLLPIPLALVQYDTLGPVILGFKTQTYDLEVGNTITACINFTHSLGNIDLKVKGPVNGCAPDAARGARAPPGGAAGSWSNHPWTAPPRLIL